MGEQQLTQRARAFLLREGGRRQRRRRRAGGERVGGHDDHGVGVRDPHVAHVLVAQVVGVGGLDLGARLHVGSLEQLVRRHALYGYLAHDAEEAEAHLGEAMVRGGVRMMVMVRAGVMVMVMVIFWA